MIVASVLPVTRDSLTMNLLVDVIPVAIALYLPKPNSYCHQNSHDSSPLL